MPDRPEIVCICGSTKFTTEMCAANRELTFAGVIVVAPIEAEESPPTEQKVVLDALPLQKIDLADRVLVVNPGGYIGYIEFLTSAASYMTGHVVTYNGKLYRSTTDNNVTTPGTSSTWVDAVISPPLLASETSVDEFDVVGIVGRGRVREELLDRIGEAGAVDDHAHLGVEGDRARIEVHRTDEHEPMIDHHRLRVQAHAGRRAVREGDTCRSPRALRVRRSQTVHW